jgi:hypothetical protein
MPELLASKIYKEVAAELFAAEPPLTAGTL